MAWYKIDIRHGPGHQSHTVEYLWHGTVFPPDGHKERLSKEDRQYLFDHVARQWDMDWPIGTVRKVNSLPPKVHEQKVSEFRANLRHADTMLQVLAETPVDKVKEKRVTA